MSIKSAGGVFGRNPTFATLTVENGISVGSLIVAGETITGLSYQGAWNANTNTPDITASPAQGQFWIVSVDGSTDVGGITNWTSGDWALYDGTNWQRVEGGNTDLTTGVSGQLAVANGGTGAADASTARTNLGLGTAAVGDIGTDVQAYDAGLQSISSLPTVADKMLYTSATDTWQTATITAAGRALLDDADAAAQRTTLGLGTAAKYDDTTANFTGTLQNGGSNVVVDTDIGSTVQGYDADTTKNDIANTFTTDQTINGKLTNNGLLLSQNNNSLQAIDGTISKHSTVGLTVRGIAGSVFDFSIYNPSGDVVLSTPTATKDIRAYGNINLVNENLVIGTSGKGIDFSATSGTGTSELLDDYEEGTWTPTLPQNGSVTYSTQFGRYTKIGNTVTVWFTVAASSWSGGSGNLNIGGLPYTTNIEGNFGFGGSLIRSVGVNLSSGYTSASLIANSTSGSHLAVYQLGDNVSTVALNYSALSTTGAISGTVTYRTS